MFAAIKFLPHFSPWPRLTTARADARRTIFKRDAAALRALGNYRPLSCKAMLVQGLARRQFDGISAAGSTLYRVIYRGKGRSAASADDRFLITACRVAARDSDAFVEHFCAAAAYMQQRDGHVRFRLFESCDGSAPYRFVNVAQWRDLNAFRQAFEQREFHQLLRAGFDLSSEVMFADRLVVAAKITEEA